MNGLPVFMPVHHMFWELNPSPLLEQLVLLLLSHLSHSTHIKSL